MLKLLADECFNNDIVRGCIRREPSLDIVRVQDVGLMHADDPEVLAWAAAEGRILCTHDVTTVPNFAYERVARGQPMPGVSDGAEWIPDHVLPLLPQAFVILDPFHVVGW